MRPTYLLLLLALCFGAALPAAQAQQSPATVPSPYGTARIWVLTSYCQLSLSDGVTPAGPFDYVRENGKPRRFADQAAALNYLYALGWDMQPHGQEEGRFYYLLKRRTP